MKKAAYLLFLIPLFGISQEVSEETLDEISFDACECISDISFSASKEIKNEEIRSCISSAIINEQAVRKTMEGLLTPKDSITKTIITQKNDSIVLDSNKAIIIDSEENYDVVQQNLLDNCPTMRELLKANNDQSDVSISDKKKAKDLYDTADNYYLNKDFENAKKYYRKAVKKDRNFAFAWDMLGLSQRNLGEYKEAIKSYEKSLKIDPTGKVPLQNLGVVYDYLKDYKNAIKSYAKYIEKYPKDPEGFYGIGRMYYVNGDSEKGVDAMIQAYLLYKDLDSPYINDAVNMISAMYDNMKENNQLDAFLKIAEKYDIDFQE